MKSVMQSRFAAVETLSAPRSSFDRSFGYKTTFDAGQLIPFYIDDVLPGDTFNLKTTGFARLATPEFPFMDNMYMDTHFFFVPHRLVWDNARKFYGEQVNPADSIDFQIPQMTTYECLEHSVSDYMGIPRAAIPNQFSVEHHCLYHRGYNQIWNEWFRDQNLQDSVIVNTDDGPDDIVDYSLLKRGKRHDYFTSCLPWPQKGDAVSMPLGSFAEVIHVPVGGNPALLVNAATGVPYIPQLPISAQNTTGAIIDDSNTNLYAIDPNQTLFADLKTATAATVNDLREAFQVQKLLERDARGGTRYSELVRNHFGVTFYDVSYRPEYLGGGSTSINSTPVAETTSLGNLGDLGAYTTAAFSNHGFTKSFVEHGFIMGFVSVRADLTYQQGMPRNFLKKTRYDIYWPSLSHLGEQAVTNAEIYYTSTTTDDDIFGYNERFSEYRNKLSQITGQFRSLASTPLDAWHLSQEFSTLPTLGDTFIQEDPPIDRIIAVPGEPHFILDTYTSLTCARPMPTYATPGMIDHF